MRRTSLIYDHLLYDDHKYAKLAQLVDPDRVVAVLEDIPDMFMEASREFGWNVPVLIKRQHNAHWRGRGSPLAVTDLVAARNEFVQRIDQWQAENA